MIFTKLKSNITILVLFLFSLKSVSQVEDTGDKVGIGTTNPTAKLHVKNSNNTYGAILANANETAFSLYTKTLSTSPVDTESFRLGLKYNNDENNGFISFYRGKGTGGGFLGFSTNGEERIRINRAGDIGIGTIDPEAKLHVNDGMMVLGSKYKDFMFATQFWNKDSNSLYIAPKNDGKWDWSKQLIYKDNGDFIVSKNLGLGTNTPQHKLHVNGTARIGNDDWGALIIDGKEKNDWLLNAHNGGEYFYIRSQADSESAWSRHVMVMRRKDGNVGIGRNPGEAKLDVNGNIRSSNVTISKSYVMNNGNTDLEIYRDENLGDWSLLRSRKGNGIGLIGQTGVLALSVSRTNNNIGIGTTDTKGFKLGVNGKIAATEVKVALYSKWPDYVFKDSYQLPTLEEVEKQITENKHLENIPSAEEVEKNGIFLGEMDAKLLQKIEELTLYTIQQEKKIKKLEAQNSELKVLSNKLYELTKRLEFLENN